MDPKRLKVAYLLGIPLITRNGIKVQLVKHTGSSVRYPWHGKLTDLAGAAAAETDEVWADSGRYSVEQGYHGCDIVDYWHEV